MQRTQSVPQYVECAQNESVKSMQTDVKSVQSVKSMQTDVKSMQSVKSVQTGQMRMSGALSLPLTVPIVTLAPTLPNWPEIGLY